MAIIKEKGTISFMSEVQSGMSQSGNAWYRQTIVVDVAGYNGSFRKVALQATGNVVGDLEQMQIGDKVEISYQVTAREYNGKWYNNVGLYKIDLEGQPQMQQNVAPAYPQNPQVNPQQFVQNGMYPGQPAPAAPAAPQRRVARPARTTPLVPPGANLEPQDDDLPC